MLYDDCNNNGYLRMRTTPIIPLVYTEALSYMEMVGKCVKKINELVDKVNNVTTDAVQQSNAYTDNAIKGLYGDIDNAVNEVESVREQLNSQYAEFVRLTNAQLNLFRGEIVDMREDLEIGLIGANDYTNFAIKQNNEYLLNELSKGLNDVKVVNYFTGELISVQNMFDYLAQFHLENAISYAQLSNKGKTFNQLYALRMSYTDLALNGAGLIV